MKDSGESEVYDITGNGLVIGCTQDNITFSVLKIIICQSIHIHIVRRD